jgi:hypothetical protein
VAGTCEGAGAVTVALGASAGGVAGTGVAGAGGVLGDGGSAEACAGAGGDAGACATGAGESARAVAVALGAGAGGVAGTGAAGAGGVLGDGGGAEACAGTGALGFDSSAGACAVVTLGVVVALRLGSGKLSSGELRIIATMTMPTAITAHASRRRPSLMSDHRLSRGCWALSGIPVPSVLPSGREPI